MADVGVAPRDQVPQIPSDDATAAYVNTMFRKALKHCRKQHEAFKEADKFVSGHQWDAEDESKLKAENRPAGVFNFVKRHINVVCGVEKLNRLQPQYVARVLDNEMANRLAALDTGIYDYVIENCDGTHEISATFEDAVKRGMGFMKARLDTISEPGGQIVWDKIDGLHLIWDPDANGKQNLKGARYFIYFSRVPAREAIAEWPEHEDYIRSGMPSDYDEQFGVSAKIEQVVPPPYDPLNKYETDAVDSSGREHVIIKECYWYVDEDWMEYIDPFQPEAGIKRMSKRDFRKFQKDYAAMFPEEPEVKGAPVKERVYKRAFVIGGKTMEESDAPVQKMFQIRCITGEWDASEGTWRGLTHLLKDPQQYLNKYLSQTMHSIATSPKGILLFEDGAFENYAMAEEQWAAWAPFIPMKQGAMGSNGVGKKFEYLPPAQPPQILYEMWQGCIKVLEQIAGINLEMLGSGEGEVPGITMRQRQAASMLAMAHFFGSYRRFLKSVAEVTLEMVREFYTDDRIIHIGGRYDGEAVSLMNEDMSHHYYVAVDENPRNPDVQDAAFQKAAPLLPGLFKSGAVMQVPSITDILPLPPQTKAELKKFLIGMGQMIAQGGGTPGGGKQQQKQSSRDNPQLIQASIEGKQAKTQEIMARARMLDQEAKLKQFKAVTEMMDAEHSRRRESQSLAMDMFKGLHGAHIDAQRAQMDLMTAMSGLNRQGGQA